MTVTVPMPPYWVRRLVIHPLLWAAFVWLLVFGLPVLVMAVAVLSFTLPGKLRLLRVGGFAVVYMALEVMVLPLMLVTWVASGFGHYLRSDRWVEVHYVILDGVLRVLFWFGSRQFNLTVRTDGPALPGDDGDPTTTEHPLLVLSRHAGPGDSFLLVHELLSWAGRRPRIVVKETLQLDPVIDLLLNRIPTRFLDPAALRREPSLTAIATLATTMRPRDALLIFPEGGNVTPGRRARAIERLRASGRVEAAARAEQIVNLLPPRPGGVHAALSANPDLRVVIVAHTGLDRLNSLGDIWREVPMAKTLELRWHEVPTERVARDLTGIASWLFDEWEAMDVWVSQRQSGPPQRPAR